MQKKVKDKQGKEGKQHLSESIVFRPQTLQIYHAENENS